MSSDLRPRRKRPLGISVRAINIALLLSCAVPAIIFIAVAWFDYVRLLDRTTVEARVTAEILREHSLKILETAELLIDDMGRRTQGMTWEAVRGQQDALIAEGQAIIARHPQISAVGLTDAQGIQQVVATRAGGRAPLLGHSVAHREFWSGQRDADRGTLITEAYIGSATHRANFGVSRRRVTQDGTFDGTIHVAIAVSYFTDFWTTAIQGTPGARVVLLRADGRILAGSPPVPAPAAYRDIEKALGHIPFVAGGSTYTVQSRIDGTPSIYGAARIANYPLQIAYSIPLSVVHRRWIEQMLSLGAVCLLSGLALAGTILVIKRQAHHLLQEQARRADAEAIALEAQRLEVMGQLAAGVAHDFGNVVHAVEAGAALIEVRTTDDRVRELALHITEAARRGRSLTRQMLDFSRAAADVDLEKAVLSPDKTISALASLLATMLGSRYQVRYLGASRTTPDVTRGDEGGLERAMMNLAINARDAMPAGGEIIIRLDAQRIVADCVEPNPASLLPGSYAHISVTDAGGGMSPEVLENAGRAFFTTKPRGQGTGLGLASARAFARSFGGGFHIESKQGVGTTVHLWLPAITADRPDLAAPLVAAHTA